MITRQHASDPASDQYERLNSAIAQEVFSEDAAGQPVYLDLEPEVLARIAKHMELGEAVEPDELLIQVVKPTLSSPDGPEGLFSAHTTQTRLWELGWSSSEPPCIAVLAMLSLIAERMQRSEGFAGSNYYGRLLQALDIDAAFHDRVGRDFRKETPFLWDALNKWLEDCNGRRGLPTAVAFDRRRFIGLPLSQALVRASDRTKLPGLFAQFGLQPGQRVSVQAMQHLLGDWLPRSQATQSLKRLWSKPANRERISEVVSAELEGWDGRLPNELRPAEHKLDDNLFLAAEIRVHPRPAVDLLLVARHGGQASHRSVALSPDAAGPALSALGRLGDHMRLQHMPGTSWQLLEPSHLVSCPELLIANVSLTVPESGATCSRHAKRLILLKRHEADHLFVEARRAELLETYLILVISDLVDSTREVLSSAARAGFRELDHQSLRGLPPGWTAFHNVQLEQVPSTSIDDLAPLQPIARTHLALGGGLPLPGMNVWHGDRLPELRIVVDEHDETGAAQVRAIPIRYLDDSEAVDVPLAEIEGAGVVDLSTMDALKDGDFRIVVTASPKGRILATASLRTRSGSWPRPLEEGEKTAIGHVLHDEICFSPFPASIAAADSESIKVVGALVDDELRPEPKKRARRTSPIPARPGVLVEDTEKDEWEVLEPISDSVSDDLPICFKRAHHHWLCAEQHGKEPVYSICKDCGREKWWEPKRKRRARKKHADNRAQVTAASTTTYQPLPTISEGDKADMELVLDALSYARTGSWRSLRAITSPINDAPWFAHEAARRLEALGHIQIEIDEKSVLPKRWCIAPSTIVTPEFGASFLAGARSARLIQAIVEVAVVLEGEVLVSQQPDGPDVIEIHGLGAEELALLVEEINEENRLELALSIRPASRIAAMLPSLGTTRKLLPELTTTARLEWLDLSSGRWISADQMDRSGAYRLRSRPWVYAVVPNASARERCSVVADVRLAKHIAASDASFALMGYDESSRTLLASSGAPLPGLLERAAVLCSGRLPAHRPDRTLAYERVPLEIAEAIWAASAIGG